MQIDEPRSDKTATGSLVQDEGFRVLPIVTEEVFHRCLSFRVGYLFTQHLYQRRRYAAKVTESSWDSELGQSGMLHKHTNEWIGLLEEKGVYVFDGWFLLQ